MTRTSCAADCGATGWRFCPHCGRPLDAPPAAPRRKPGLEELAQLRGEHRSWKQIAVLYGFTTPSAVHGALVDAQFEWRRRSEALLGARYRAAGGAVATPVCPPYRGSGEAAYREFRAAYDAYADALEQWYEAIGMGEVERAIGRNLDDRWLQAACAGQLPGPIPRWPPSG